jgi:hypothetical protein
MLAKSKCQTIAAVFALTLIAPVTVAGAQASETTRLNLAGAYPGMTLHAFRMLHGNATITRMTAVRYCYGHPIASKEPTRQSALVTLERTTLTVNFGKHGASFRAAAIELREEISPQPERIRRIRDRLIRKFGPIDEVLHRRKMEPAGLIVGFRWKAPDGSVLTAKVHRDHSDDLERFYLTSTLANPTAENHPSHRADKRNRNTLRAFRDRCFGDGMSTLVRAKKATTHHDRRQFSR